MNLNTEHTFVWQSSFEVGVPIIDDQHRVLIKMINEANSKLSDARKPAELEEVVQGLLSYADYHFETEEAYAVEHHYDTENSALYRDHIAQHRAFTQDVMAIKAQITRGEPVSKAQLIGFLEDWLVKHIFDTDKKLGEFICTK